MSARAWTQARPARAARPARGARAHAQKSTLRARLGAARRGSARARRWVWVASASSIPVPASISSTPASVSSTPVRAGGRVGDTSISQVAAMKDTGLEKPRNRLQSPAHHGCRKTTADSLVRDERLGARDAAESAGAGVGAGASPSPQCRSGVRHPSRGDSPPPLLEDMGRVGDTELEKL